MRFFDPPHPRFFAHRGSSAAFPENTLPAFQAAFEAGIPYFELDVWGSRDGRVVVHHDETLERTCGDPRRIADLDWREIAGLDAGYAFTPDGRTHPFRSRGIAPPLLEEVLTTFPGVRIIIEIKQTSPPIEAQVLEVVRRTGSEERVLLASESDAVLARMRAICGEIPTGMSAADVAAFIRWVQGGCAGEYRPPGAALQIPERFGEIRLVTPQSVAAAHAAGLEVHVWTVNEVEEMRRLLAMGVDGVMSDYPERLLEAAGSRPERAGA